MSAAEDWAGGLARLIAERYCQKFEIEAETATVLRMIERHCPFRRGVTYVEGTPPTPSLSLDFKV